MFGSRCDEDEFYLYALRLLKAAGHAVNYNCVSCNQTPQQVLYFNHNRNLILTSQQREMLKEIANISHLFNIREDNFGICNSGSISYYSIELLCSNLIRSEIAYYTHQMLIPVLSGKANIIIFHHNKYVIFSAQGFGSDIYLSSWYEKENDYDKLIDCIDIADISMKSAKEFLMDFIYNCARWYYRNPISKEEALFDSIPINYMSELDRENLQLVKEDLIVNTNNILNQAEIEYCDDYIDQNSLNMTIVNNVNDFEFITLDLDIEEGDIGSSNDGFENNEFINSEEKYDDFSISEIESSIFNDPISLLNYLKKTDNNE